ncbi:MAG: type III pantothenate kinase [Dehalococcoidia bacterium]|nr:type III pantothenate kinase [Dehalococcoidia bacterium]
MLLAIDIGNTNVKLGVFNSQILACSLRVATDPSRLADDYATSIRSILRLHNIQASDITNAAMCSVVPPVTSMFRSMLQKDFHCDPLIVSAEVRTRTSIGYENPMQLGADRIVAAAAAYHLYGGPVIVVDFGTAVKFEAVTRDGEHQGGAILPGLRVAADSLFRGSSQLRRVDIVRPPSPIGRNVTASIQAGLVYGYASMVEGMVARLRGEIGQNAKAIATGGQAALIAAEAKVFHAVNPDLTIQGLRFIYDLNT